MDYSECPDELPERPVGWKRKLTMHMKFADGGAAAYEVFDENSRPMPIDFQYDTSRGGETGFSLRGVPVVMSWEQLRVRWIDWIAERKKNDKAKV